MSRMFLTPDRTQPMKTWNIWVGCEFGCEYCNARKAALTRFKHITRYKDGFRPHLVPEEFSKTFKPGDFVFIGYMGELSFAPRPVVSLILSKVRQYPQSEFLFCVKDPSCYKDWGFEYPRNLYLGATIESNIDHGLSKAPPPRERYKAMCELGHEKKFVSMEPLLDFHLCTFVEWMKEIKPEIIEVGPDNYHNNLPEPKSGISGFRAPWKVRWLLEMLREFCPTVVEKTGLDRLKR